MSFIIKFDATKSDDDINTLVSNISSVLVECPEQTSNLRLLLAGESVFIISDTEEQMKEQLEFCMDEGTTVYVNNAFFTGEEVSPEVDEEGIEAEIEFIALHFNTATKKETLAALGA